MCELQGEFWRHITVIWITVILAESSAEIRRPLAECPGDTGGQRVLGQLSFATEVEALSPWMRHQPERCQ